MSFSNDSRSGMLDRAQSSENNGTSNEGSLDVNTNVILKVECISRLFLKKFMFCQVILRWAAVCCWLLFAALSARKSFNHQQEQRNLYLATSLSGFFLLGSIAILATLICFVVRVSGAQQQWTQPRRRLVRIAVYQLICVIVASAFFFASSCYASKLHCNSISSFCIWSWFVQWTFWNTLLFVQLLMAHSACVWTNNEAQPQRNLLMHLSPWLREKPRNAMILEAPWYIHLPKLILWFVVEATLIIQLVVALQGHIYRPHAQDVICSMPLAVCIGSHANKAAVIVRGVAVGLGTIWHMTVLVQGMNDMVRMPMDQFRMGRMLIRLISSTQLSTGSTLLPFISLIIVTVQSRCPSCQPSYVLLGLIVSCTILMGMGSVLMHPKSNSTDDDILMQVWLQRFAWTEQKLAARIRKRNSLPKDPTLLRDEPMFCFETAVKLLYWCGFVYEHDEGRKLLAASEETAMKLYNLERLELIRDPLTSTKCLVAWGQDTVVVAFRGTANRQNAVHDIKAWLVPHIPDEAARLGCGIGSTAAVHQGFNVSWGNALKKDVCDVIQKAVKQSGSDATKMRVLVTGHSLGGVMAVLAAYDIADLNPWGSLQVYTVGAPRPGNRAFAQQYNAKVPHTWHVINPKDPVPKVGKFWVLFSRPGQRVLVNQGGDMQVRPTPLDRRLAPLTPAQQTVQGTDWPLMGQVIKQFTFMKSVKCHFLASYRACFVNILKAELKRPRFEEGLEGVLYLADSISLTDTLAAADLESSANGKGATLTKEAVVQSVAGLVANAASIA